MCQVGDLNRRLRLGEWRGCVVHSSLARRNKRCILAGGEFERGHMVGSWGSWQKLHFCGSLKVTSLREDEGGNLAGGGMSQAEGQKAQ